MKKTMLLIISLIILIAVIPVTAGIKMVKFEKTDSKSESAKRNNIVFTDSEKDYIIGNVMEYITEDSCKETKRAVLTICANNAAYKKENNISQKNAEISKYSDSFYEELKTMLQNEYTTLYYENKRVYIPVVRLCPGYIVEDEAYPYIACVASPWDKLSADYNENAEIACGISIYGIDSLCSQGYSCEQVLSHFLPYFTIQQ